MSGWWSIPSASTATWSTASTAVMKRGNLTVRSMDDVPPVQPGRSPSCRAISSGSRALATDGSLADSTAVVEPLPEQVHHLTADGRRVVVAAALVREGRLLAARRTAPPDLAGRWELPGGKVEPGETPRTALRRELAEELGIDAEVGARLDGSWPLGTEAVLLVFVVACPPGVAPQALQHHDDLRWLSESELDDVPWLDGDRPAVRAAVTLLR